MIRSAALLAMLATPASAVTLDLPGRPKLAADDTAQAGSMLIPNAVWNGTEVPGQVFRGQTQRQVFHLEDKYRPSAMTSTLAEQLRSEGFEILLECQDRACGGFDFRFALPLLPPPEMYVDLGNYSFVSATNDMGQAVMVLVSRTQTTTHVHFSFVAPQGSDAPLIEQSAVLQPEALPVLAPSTGPEDLPLATALETKGRAILSDLVFATGSSQLDGTTFASLDELANYMSANPERTVALVGHTDAVGSLDGNIALSKKRAGAVRTLFLQQNAIASERVTAEGMGYLAPIAPNTTDAGRTQNRRVEVIVTSTN